MKTVKPGHCQVGQLPLAGRCLIRRQLASFRGFTILELVVVLVVAGFLWAISIPVFFDIQVFRAKGFFDELTAATRYAQKFAVATGCQVQLSLTSSNYALLQRTNCDTSSDFTRAVLHPTKFEDFTANTPFGVSIAPAPTTIVFDPLGRASSTVTITVGGHQFRINDQTGYVEIL